MPYLADISIKNPVFAWMIMAFLIVFGAISFSQLGVSQMPDVDFPNVTISVAWEGASPEIMETDVLDPIEDAIMSVQGIRDISSTARMGSASISIEFELERNVDAAVQEVQTKLSQVQRLLPRDIDPPIVSKSNPEDQPIVWITLSGQVPLRELADFARDHVKDRFQTISGVGEVQLGGYLERNLRVWLKIEELESRQIAVEDVLAALGRENIEVPSGRIEMSEREMNVRSLGEAPTVEEFRNIVVAYRNGSPVIMDQIAIVEDGSEDRRRIARSRGEPAVGLGIKKQRGANAVEVARAVRERAEEIKKTVPSDMALSVVFDSTRFIEDSVKEMYITLGLAAVLTSLVCLLFLGSWASTFNIVLAIPTSIIGALTAMYFLGFTLNMFTLLGLSLAVGIVVDDAIMVLENIVRHQEKGEAKRSAASRGAREITFAAIATTLAIIAIFLPIAFMKGILGKFLYQFGVTMSVAVALSLLEALTLTPMRASVMVQVGKRRTAIGRFLDRSFQGLAAAYRRTLGLCLRWRWAVILLAIGLFVGSFAVARGLRQEIVPPQDEGRFVVQMRTPVGSSLAYTDERLRQCEQILLARPEVDNFFAFIGGFGGGQVDSATMFVALKPPAERRAPPGEAKPMTQQQIIEFVRARFNKIPGLIAAPSDLSMATMAGRGGLKPVEFVVTGSDWDELARRSRVMMEKMTESGMMVDVDSNYRVGMPELKIFPQRKRAADLGISAQAIGTTINVLIGGVRASKFTEGGHRFDVRVRLISDQRSRPDDVKRLFVRTRGGGFARLSEVIQTLERPTNQSITRRNRQRAITVSCGIAPGVSQKVVMDKVQEIANEVLGDRRDYNIQFTGSAKLFKEGVIAFLFAIGLGIVVAYMVLASQFNSFVHPVLVLLALPLSLIGAVVAMLWANISFNMYSMIGIVLLMGIVKKNSILLVDFTNKFRKRGWTVKESLMEACPIRLRPILMTSFATVAAAIPAALALGPGAESRIPMAVVVIGGVIFSTFLTLIVVPCVYAIIPGRVKVEEEESAEPAAADHENGIEARPALDGAGSVLERRPNG